MSTFTAIPFALSAIAIIIALAFMYLRKHPDAVQSVESEWTKIHTKLDTLLAHVQATHAAALAPVTVALVPVSTPPAAAPAPLPLNTTDPTAPGFVAPPPAAAAPALEPPTWTPSPVMKFADCTGQNIPINPQTTYTITDCPAVTMVGTNATTLPCDPYNLTVNGVSTFNPIQTSQCTVNVTGSTITVSVSPATAGGVVNLILQVHAGA